MIRSRHLICAALAGLSLCGAWSLTESKLDTLREQHRAESHAAAVEVRERVAELFRQTYQGLRTIARLPGVRAIDRHAEHLSPDSSQSVQELYNNLASSVAMSEVYIVPLDLDPDHVDPFTGELGAPILTFDELIVDRHRDQEHGEEHEESELEELEIYEYRLMRRQLDWFREHAPTESAIQGLDFPAIAGHPVITCDNTRYSPSAPNDDDRTGIVYSVPFYDPRGALAGCISGVVLVRAVEDLLPRGEFALRCAEYGLVARSAEPGPVHAHAAAVRDVANVPELLYSEVLPIEITDHRAHWRLWSARDDADFEARADVRAARQSGWLLAIVALAGSAALAWYLESSERRRRAARELNAELERRVSERTEELVRARDAAEAASQAKSNFLATMSHEIRTPMNGVIGMTGLLLDTELSRTQRDYAQTVRSCAEALLAILNDILDFSKIEANKIELETIDFELHGAIEESVELLAERAQSKGLELLTQLDPRLPRVVAGDPGRMRQVLLNLTGNAIKFTETGEVVVHVALEREEADHVLVRCAVRDTGIGIPPDAKNRLFQSFSQVDASTTRKYGGTGLGLAICKRLAELMGGAIGVESTPGSGSTFWFTVRLEKRPGQHLASPSLLVARAGLRVLCVDDNATNRTILRTQLETLGLRASEAVDGARALVELDAAHASSDPYGLAILDMMMPHMDGVSLARRIRATPHTATLPLVMLSSWSQRGYAAEAKLAGIDQVLSKPCRQSHLHHALVQALKLEPAPEAPLPRLEHHEDGTGPVEHAPRVRLLIAEDNQVNQRLVLALLSKLGFDADVVANGIEALEAVRARTYAAVLMDCSMPEMDGFQAARAWREEEAGESRLPIIALTANAMSGDRERCLAAGMDDYVTKPIRLEELRAALERALGARHDA